MLKVNNLNKNYKSFSLKNISFDVKKGSITGFIGNNGAGKTTTLKCILGLTSYESGEISIAEKTLMTNEREYKEKIGIVFDDGYFYDILTLKEMKNIISKSYSKWNEERYRYYLDKFGLLETQKINELSKGMKMKFSISIAFSHNADILLLDEPSSGLDPQTRNMLCEELLNQKLEGKTIFFSTHVTSDLDKIGDNIILIDNGSIIFNSTKSEFLQNPNGSIYSTVEESMLDRIKR